MEVHDTEIVERIAFRFSLPQSGWIRLDLSAGDHAADWDLTWAPDPFSACGQARGNDYCLTLISWLEAIAAGQSPALGIDMEGPVGALVVSGEAKAPLVTLLALTDPGRLDFAVRIARHALVRDVYDALMTYWNGADLKAVWTEWSQLPQWRLRSAKVEDYLAGQTA